VQGVTALDNRGIGRVQKLVGSKIPSTSPPRNPLDVKKMYFASINGKRTAPTPAARFPH
jgi:hypothetical protein